MCLCPTVPNDQRTPSAPIQTRYLLMTYSANETILSCSWTTLKMEKAMSPETSTTKYQSTQCHFSDNCNILSTTLCQSKITQYFTKLNYKAPSKDPSLETAIAPQFSADHAIPSTFAAIPLKFLISLCRLGCRSVCKMLKTMMKSENTCLVVVIWPRTLFTRYDNILIFSAFTSKPVSWLATNTSPLPFYSTYTFTQ
jgi:hypothetical protein